jgi:iron complex outermembrane receptor protein
MSWRGSWGNYIYNNVDSSKGSFQNILLRETDLSNGCQYFRNRVYYSGHEKI